MRKTGLFKKEDLLTSSDSESSQSESEFGAKHEEPLKEMPKQEPKEHPEDPPKLEEKSEREDSESRRNYMISGDLKERFFSDDEADMEIENEIKDSNQVREKCIEDAQYLCKYLQVKCNEMPSILVVEELQYIMTRWNQKGKLCLQHDLVKPQIRKLFWGFMDMICSNLEDIQYNVILKLMSLLEIMKETKGVFRFQINKIEGMEEKFKSQLIILEKKFTENTKKNFRKKKKRKVIRKKRKLAKT